MWNITTAIGESLELEALLKVGWEPFAVTEIKHNKYDQGVLVGVDVTHLYHLRLKK